ncbi:hypothetical protein C8J56DRAFT_172078 [Mycena floridula]|nr:hypothetical protein C8J56DRAFT_172078 [Mycena floridula]
MFSFKFAALLVAATALKLSSASASPLTESSMFASRAAATVDTGLHSDSTAVILINVCTDLGFAGTCTSLNFPLIPTGCVTVPPGWNNIISSAYPAPGIICTLFTGVNTCTGRSVVIAGDVASLASVGMDNAVNTLSCVST